MVNNFASPLWKLPVFVKAGAIIPMTNPNNNVGEIDKNLRIYELYPSGYSEFVEYDDDGITQAYLNGKGTTTRIEIKNNDPSKVSITIHPTTGDFDGFVKDKATELRINLSEMPKKITAKVGSSKVKLVAARSMDEYLNGTNVYFYDATPNLNKFATKGSEFEKVTITKNPQLLVKLAPTDIIMNETVVTIDGYQFDMPRYPPHFYRIADCSGCTGDRRKHRSLHLKTDLG